MLNTPTQNPRLIYSPRLYGHLLSSTGSTATPGSTPGSSPVGCQAYPVLYPQIITGLVFKLNGALVMNANPARGRIGVCLYGPDPSDPLTPKTMLTNRAGAPMLETFQYHDGTGGTTPSNTAIYKTNTKLFPRSASGVHLDCTFTTPSPIIAPGQIIWFGFQFEATITSGAFRTMNPESGCADYSGTSAAFDPATTLTSNAQSMTGFAVATGSNTMYGLEFLVKTQMIF